MVGRRMCQFKSTYTTYLLPVIKVGYYWLKCIKCMLNTHIFSGLVHMYNKRTYFPAILILGTLGVKTINVTTKAMLLLRIGYACINICLTSIQHLSDLATQLLITQLFSLLH